MHIFGAFINRFSIGVLIPVANLGMSKILSGILIGLLLSIPIALLITVYMWPVLIGGIVGDGVIGFIARRKK